MTALLREFTMILFEAFNDSYLILIVICVWFHRIALSLKRRLHEQPVPCRGHMRHIPAGRILHLLLSSGLDGRRLHRRPQRMPRKWVKTLIANRYWIVFRLGHPVWAWRILRQHPGVIQVRLCRGVRRTQMRTQHQRVCLGSVPERWHVSRRTRSLHMRLHGRWVWYYFVCAD